MCNEMCLYRTGNEGKTSATFVFFDLKIRSGKNSGAIFVATMFSEKSGDPTDNKITM
jgi:hypothetical protein